jgi:diacylglycerol kinase (ATP)
MKSRHTGLAHLKYSTRYSLKGLKAAWRNEEAFRQELILCALLLPFAWWIGDSHVEWLLLVGSTLIVLMVELLNSAVESAIDRIGPEFHELSGRAKDMGSAAVKIRLIITCLLYT